MLRKRNLKRYNPFKEFETKYEEGENILTKIRSIYRSFKKMVFKRIW